MALLLAACSSMPWDSEPDQPAAPAPATMANMADMPGMAAAPALPASAASAALAAPVASAAPTVQELAPQPAPAPVAAPAMPAEPMAPASAAVLVHGFYINVGLFAVQGNASNAFHILDSNGLPVFSDSVKSKGRTLTRVRVGPYVKRAQAALAVKKIRGLGLDAVLFKH